MRLIDKMVIEYDKAAKCWIVWLRLNNLHFDLYHGKTKKDCLRWINEL